MQTRIDFSSAVIRPHNNTASDMQVRKNRRHFESQTMKVLRLLQSGHRLTSASAPHEHGIGDLRARIHNLERLGFEIIKEEIQGAHGAIEYSMEVK